MRHGFRVNFQGGRAVKFAARGHRPPIPGDTTGRVMEEDHKMETGMFGVMKRATPRLFVLLIVFAALAPPFFAAASERFEQHDFKLRGEVTDVIVEDLDGDGLMEAIAIHIDDGKDPPARYLSIFPQTKDGGFSPSRKTEWRFPSEVATVDVGDVSPDPGRELVFITERGVSYSSVTNGRVGPMKDLLSVLSVVAIPYERGVPYYNFVRDYTGDGKDDILVVGFSEALLAIQKGDHEWIEEKLRLRPSMNIQAWDIGRLLGDSEHPMYRVSYYVPQIYSADANADGLPDLVVNFRRKVQVFPQKSGGFASEPSATYKLELLKDSNKRSRRGGGRNPAFLAFEDLDGDGKVDVIATQSAGTIGDMDSRTGLFLGKDRSLPTGNPTMEFDNDHTVMGIFVHDVNNDGKQDLVMPTMDLGAWSAGKVLFTGGMNVNWNFFIQKDNRSFPKTPDRSFLTTLKFNIGKFRLEGGVPNVFGDFNGDGFPDQAVGEDTDLLVVRLRDGEGELLDLREEIEIPVSMFNRAIDVNQDGLHDIVIHYEDVSEHVSEFHILVNKGNWSED